MSIRNCSIVVYYVWFVQQSGGRLLEEEVGITKISWCRVWMEEPFTIPFTISGVLTVTTMLVECGYSHQMTSLIECNSEQNCGSTVDNESKTSKSSSAIIVHGYLCLIISFHRII